MKAIISWLEGLVDIITGLVVFVIDFIGQMFQLVEMLVDAAATIPELFAFLPPPVVTICVSFLSVAVLFKILGRE